MESRWICTWTPARLRNGGGPSPLPDRPKVEDGAVDAARAAYRALDHHALLHRDQISSASFLAHLGGGLTSRHLLSCGRILVVAHIHVLKLIVEEALVVVALIIVLLLLRVLIIVRVLIHARVRVRV